jgi:ketosteroid isomerase-like protein
MIPSIAKEKAMDDIEANKRLVRQMFELLSAGHFDPALALIAEDATWWLAGKPGKLPVCGTLPKQKVAKLFHNITGALEAPLAMTVHSIIAEGDQVAAEVESRGRLKSGRTYHQQYHFRFTIRSGRICAVREYLDTLHVQETWAAPA